MNKSNGNSTEMLSKTVNEMVADLKYQKDMMDANIVTTKELLHFIDDYLKKTKMTQHIDTLMEMDKDKINSMSIDDINNIFSGHELVPWDAPLVNDMVGEYGYSEDEYHKMLIELFDRVTEYTRIVELINQSQKYLANMGKKLQEVRLNHAKYVAKTGGENAAKAQRYIDDIENINKCQGFVDHVRKHRNEIINASHINMLQKFSTWCDKNPLYRDFASTIQSSTVLDDGINNDDRMFIFKCILSYIKYENETLTRDSIIKKSIINQLYCFFKGYLLPDENEVLRNQIYCYILSCTGVN